jgi:hypothetical protein
MQVNKKVAAGACENCVPKCFRASFHIAKPRPDEFLRSSLMAEHRGQRGYRPAELRLQEGGPQVRAQQQQQLRQHGRDDRG